MDVMDIFSEIERCGQCGMVPRIAMFPCEKRHLSHQSCITFRGGCAHPVITFVFALQQMKCGFAQAARAEYGEKDVFKFEVGGAWHDVSRGNLRM